MLTSVSFRVVQGVRVPAFLYGTAWKEDRTLALTAAALDAGFRGFDTANQRRHYVEALVGDAVAGRREQDVPRREDLFLQTKFTYVDSQDERLPYDRDAPPESQVLQSFESSLTHLRTTYLDSYLLHGPSSDAGLDEADRRVWRTLESLKESGKTRLIGVSNVSFAQLELLWQFARVKPAFVQNRCYARTGWDRKVRDFCRANAIGYQGFSLLTANAKELRRQVVERIRARLGVTTPELVFAFALQSGMFPLTGTSNPEHMRNDLSAGSLELRPEELEALDNLVG